MSNLREYILQRLLIELHGIVVILLKIIREKILFQPQVLMGLLKLL